MINNKICRKRRMKAVRTLSLFEISLLITMTFAVAFIMHASFVSADANTINTLNNMKNYDSRSIAVPDTSFDYNKLSTAPVMTGATGGAVGLAKTGVTPAVPAGTEKLPFLDITVSASQYHLITGIGYAALVAGVIQLVGPMLGLQKTTTNAATVAAVAGIMTWKVILAAGSSLPKSLVLNAGWIGLGVGVLLFLYMYKDEKQKIVKFQCLPWEPPLGGADCEKCNKQKGMPCNEYRCRSLGQACSYENAGIPGKGVCVWKNKNDVSSPTITPLVSALQPAGTRYTPDTARPAGLGSKIEYLQSNDKCLPALSKLQFGISTNEPAQCKIDYGIVASSTNATFDSMQFYFGEENYYAYNHTQVMKMPWMNNISGVPEIKPDGTMSLFVKCRDANGNENSDVYSFSFCVSKLPDTTPPIIERTDIREGMPVAFGTDSTNVNIYVNEYSECRWSHEDKTYETMENQMTCPTGSSEVNAELLYTCSGTLTGIKDRVENKFYFRCKDNPGSAEADRHVMINSYPLTIMGSQPLTILNVGPNGTIKESTGIVPVYLKVETAQGFSNGNATCEYSTSASSGFIEMKDTKSFIHSQRLDLSAGTYTYYFKCYDIGANTATTNVSFRVEVDEAVPVIARVYKENDAVKIVTSEDAECVYDWKTCNFNFADGLKMSYADPANKRVSIAQWMPKATYYLKCKDMYGNEPGACSLIVNAVDEAVAGTAG